MIFDRFDLFDNFDFVDFRTGMRPRVRLIATVEVLNPPELATTKLNFKDHSCGVRHCLYRCIGK